VWEKTPDGKLYIESQRRYNALIELSSTSLNAVSANHKAQAGLIDVLKNSGVETKKTELSVADLMEEYIRAKFSPKEVKDLATATDSLKILRSMAQSESFRMWMDYKLLASIERTEALMAAQLPLLADIAMRDKMKEQYKATFNAGGAQTSK
jgi:oligoribonuclease (3'-5' exoribonuclease)